MNVLVRLGVAAVFLINGVSVGSAQDIPAPDVLSKLIMSGYERCLGPHRHLSEQQAMCACEVKVLAQARLTEVEWRAFIEQGQTPRRPLNFQPCRQSSDEISEVVRRFTRTVQCTGTPHRWS